MNPGQTALLEQSDLGPYCLQYRLHMREAETKVVTDREMLMVMGMMVSAEQLESAVIAKYLLS